MTPQEVANPRRKRRRGASPARRKEQRILTALIGLRMSKADHAAIEWKAKQVGYPSAQHWIRESIKPAVERAKLEMGGVGVQEPPPSEVEEGPVVDQSGL